MERDEASSPGRRRFFTRRVVIALSVVGFLLLIGIVWVALTLAARAEVEGELAKIRARGEPAAWAELAPPPVPDEENAAILLEQAVTEAHTRLRAAGMDRSGLVGKDELGLHDPSRSFDRAGAAKMLKDCAKAVVLALEASRRRHCRFDLDYGHSSGMLPAGLFPVAELLAVQASLHAHSGRAEEAAESASVLLDLALLLAEESCRAWWSGVYLRYGLDSLQETERLAPLGDDARRRLLDRLGRFDLRRAARQEIVTTRAAVHGYVEEVFAGKAGLHSPTNVWLRSALRAFPFVFLQDEARCLRLLTEAVDATSLPPWEAVAELKLICARADATPLWRAPFTKTMFGLPGQFSSWVRPYVNWARRDVAVIGLACGLYRSKHGRYPDKLDDLAPALLPAVPQDPFTGKPFAYRRKGEAEGEGFVVYSVGPDLTDNGGAGDDIIWEGGAAKRAP